MSNCAKESDKEPFLGVRWLDRIYSTRTVAPSSNKKCLEWYSMITSIAGTLQVKRQFYGQTIFSVLIVKVLNSIS